MEMNKSINHLNIQTSEGLSLGRYPLLGWTLLKILSIKKIKGSSCSLGDYNLGTRERSQFIRKIYSSWPKTSSKLVLFAASKSVLLIASYAIFNFLSSSDPPPPLYKPRFKEKAKSRIWWDADLFYICRHTVLSVWLCKNYTFLV